MTTLEWTLDRFAQGLEGTDLAAIGSALGRLRTAADAGDDRAAMTHRDELQALVASIITPTG